MSQAQLRPHDVIAQRVRELRTKRGWSGAHLAAELNKVGIPWDRSIVANLENRRRATVSVEELFALAYVFSVAPLHLMVPPIDVNDPPRFDTYVVVPGVTAGLETVRAWIRGLVEPFGDPRLYAAEMPPHEQVPDSDGRMATVLLEAKLTEEFAKRSRNAEGPTDGR